MMGWLTSGEGRTTERSREWIRRLLRGFELDLRSLALYRVALGAIVLWDVASRAPAYAAFYSDFGALPRELASMPLPHFSLFFASGEPAWALLCLALTAVAALALLVGFYTRWATPACWLLVCSLIWRNQLVVQGGDELLSIQLLWGCFLPLGARFSLDARGAASSNGQRFLSLGTVAIGIQFILFYFFTGANKTGPEWHGEGDAIRTVLRNTYWTRPLGEWLLQSPLPTAMLSRAIPWLEMSVPFLMVSPFATSAFRFFAIGVLLAFQASMGMTIELMLFPWVCIVATLPFLPAGFWDWLAKRTAILRHGATTSAEYALDFAPSLQATLLVGTLVAWSLLSVAAPTKPLLERPLKLIVALRHDWLLYAPSPSVVDIQPAFYGTMGGAEINLHTARLGPDWSRLQRIMASTRHRYAVEKLIRAAPSAAPLREQHLLWLCREWQRQDSGGTLNAVRLVVRSRVVNRPEEQPTQIRSLAKVRCTPE